MPGSDGNARVTLDLDNQTFQENLFSLQKTERHAALDTLSKIRQLTWQQVYRDKGLKWEKIFSVRAPQGVDAIYSLRITQSRRATAFRDGPYMRMLTVAADHDSTYGKKWSKRCHVGLLSQLIQLKSEARALKIIELENSPTAQVWAVTVLESEPPQLKTKSGKDAKEKESVW